MRKRGWEKGERKEGRRQGRKEGERKEECGGLESLKEKRLLKKLL